MWVAYTLLPVVLIVLAVRVRRAFATEENRTSEPLA